MLKETDCRASKNFLHLSARERNETMPHLSLTCLTRPSCCVRCVDTASSSFTGAMTWPTKPRSDLVPKHFPSSPDLLNFLCIEHSNSSVTILRSAGLNFAQYIYFTFYYFQCSELWTHRSSGTGICRSNTKTTFTMPQAAKDDVSALVTWQSFQHNFNERLRGSHSLSCNTLTRCGKNWHRDVKLKLVLLCDTLCIKTCFVQPCLWFSNFFFCVHRFSVLALKVKPEHL